MTVDILLLIPVFLLGIAIGMLIVWVIWMI